MRKRELAKAERRLKRNEVVEMNISTTFDADEQDGIDNKVHCLVLFVNFFPDLTEFSSIKIFLH